MLYRQVAVLSIFKIKPMKKEVIIGLGLGISLVLLGYLAVISFNPSNSSTALADQTAKQPADKIQVYLFHATQRCVTCIAIGRLAGETVDEYFQPEISNGTIEFKEINIDLPENKYLAQKFQASGSALYINAIKDGQDNISEDVTVWRLTSNKDQFKTYLRDKINNLLGRLKI
jgi:hypothetical protein